MAEENEILLRLAELRTDITTQRMEQSDKFRNVDERLRNMEVMMGRIEERILATHTIACDAHDTAQKAERNSWIALAGGITGGSTTILKLAGVI